VKEVGLWSTYLTSFPAGTNPIFIKRTEHDCHCCKDFLRAVGNVVCVIEGELVSVWDFEPSPKLDDGYRVVAAAMSKLVRSKPIVDSFLHFERTAGTARTLFDKVLPDRATVSSFEHFFVNLPSKYVAHGVDIPSTLGKARSAQQVFKRALDEIKEDAVTTTLELIGQGALYRGDQFSGVLTAFQQEQAKYKRVAEGLRENHVWMRCAELAGTALLHVRNSSIGTLLKDLSDGEELEDAVKKFESVMAPTNYKRPTALVSKAQIAQAKQTIEALGLGSALERRYAVIEDINVNDILFANRSARKSMKADVFDELASTVPVKPQSLDKVEDVPIERFIADILPRISTMELMFEKRLMGNLVSLVAPVDPTAKRLFKWDNGFSWSYNGDAADAIKERVKLAGGAVEGALCCRLAWDYTDDLDLHMREPSGGERINYAHRRSRAGGVLDVDANGMDGIRPDPVENIVYASKQKMPHGVYVLEVNNYSRRSDGRGFEVEIEFGREFGGEVRYNFVYDKVLRTQETVEVAHIKCTPTGFEVVESLPVSTVSKQIWNIATHTVVPVNVLMLSPNHWGAGRATGSKHWFFMLEGCKNDGQARPYFNEFLTEELTAHRKVLELVGSKTKTELSERQLSGLGFSSTVRNSVLCKVTGSFSRVINLVF
jgi:hypothetical protein